MFLLKISNNLAGKIFTCVPRRIEEKMQREELESLMVIEKCQGSIFNVYI